VIVCLYIKTKSQGEPHRVPME